MRLATPSATRAALVSPVLALAGAMRAVAKVIRRSVAMELEQLRALAWFRPALPAGSVGADVDVVLSAPELEAAARAARVASAARAGPSNASEAQSSARVWASLAVGSVFAAFCASQNGGAASSCDASEVCAC